MPVSPDESSWFDPKWLVVAVALAAFGLILSYDLRLGLAAGAVLGVIGAFWLYVSLRYGALSTEPASGRQTLVARLRSQSSNRRYAAARIAETSGAQQGSDPAERP